MKRLLLIGLLLLCGQGAFAATRCVPNIVEMDCYPQAPQTNSPEIPSTCTNGSITATVLMMGMCATDYFSTEGEVADTINISPTPEENTYCWCRMLQPALSKWISIESGDCASNSTCAHSCRLSGYGRSIFRNRIMNNLL